MNRIPDRRDCTVWPRNAAVRQCNVVNSLMRGAVGIEPAFNDLDTVEIGAVEVAQRAHCPSSRSLRQGAALG